MSGISPHTLYILSNITLPPAKMGKRKRPWHPTAIAMLIIFSIILYLIELLTSRPIFNLTRFSLNYVISLPFILLSIITVALITIGINRPKLQKWNAYLKITLEGISTILVAGIMVIVGNLPFIDDIVGYVTSGLYWKSVAAATLINILILVTFEFFIQTSISRRLQHENAILQYRQLKSQINPHSLFNSLNALVYLINKDQDLAVKYTKDLSFVYRYVLTHDQQDTVTIREEIEFIGYYIEILKTCFSHGLRFIFDIKSPDLCKSTPPMSLQLLIENAVNTQHSFTR